MPRNLWRAVTVSGLMLLGVTLTATTTSEAKPLLGTDLIGPPGSGSFGDSTFLPNGNLVVTDPAYDAGTSADAGAVYVYSPNGALLNTLIGSHTNDRVGSAGIAVLTDGAFAVMSSNWSDSRGALTHCPAEGCGGEVSAANSLVGGTVFDLVGAAGSVDALSSGTYVVHSPNWDNAAVVNAGAVTGCPATGCVGLVSSLNSLVGSAGNDLVGERVVTSLAGGAYVVSSPQWNNGAVVDAGAVTWCVVAGCTGAVSATNSLVGSTALDGVGDPVPLSNGKYAVVSPSWDNGAVVDAGAVTLCPAAGCTGVVSPAISLVGSAAGDMVGSSTVVSLPGGAYVVGSWMWNNGAAADVGAVTRCPAAGCLGAVSTANSLVGSTAGDHVGRELVVLGNGSYVVNSEDWLSGGVHVGAITWCPTTGCVGAVSVANSLVGGGVPSYIHELEGSAYVVRAPNAFVGSVSTGAVTWCAPTGCVGAVSAANSLVGSQSGDRVGASPLVMLVAGPYVVLSPDWHNGGAAGAGAVTRCNATGCVGVVSASNSLVGSDPGDAVGSGGAVPLSLGGYVVQSPSWDNGAMADVGAATGCPATGCVGVVSAANSLVGASTNDSVGRYLIEPLADGSYVVPVPDWNNGAIVDVGAVIHCPSSGCAGAVSAANSLIGSTAGDQVGQALKSLSGGGYLVISPHWDDGSAADVGAVTYVAGGADSVVVSAANSVLGRVSGSGTALHVSLSDDDAVMAAGFLIENRVVLARVGVEYVPLVPARLLDTRPTAPGVATVDGQFVSRGAVPGGSTLELQVTGRGGVAADAKAVALNVTVTEPGGAGYVTVFPCGVDRPNASNLNYTAGETIPNAVISKVGAGGTVCLFTISTTHLIVDVTGVLPPISTYTPVVPARLLDTRPAGPGIATADGQFVSGGAVVGGTTLELEVAGRVEVPGDASAVALNVTVTEAAAAGFVTVFPCGVDRPNASNLNYTPGDTVPNAVIAKIGAGGNVCLFASATTHLIVDVNGVMPKLSGYNALVPARLLDTRPAGPGIATVDGMFESGGVVAGGQTVELQVAGRGGVSTDATAVVLNVTVTEPAGAGFVTVFPCGVDRPLASNLNYVAGDTVPNAVLSALGSSGSVCLFASSTLHLIADVNGVL